MIVASSRAAASPQTGITTIRATTMAAAVRAGSSCCWGVRERAAPRRMRLMGTAAAPSLVIAR